MWDRCFLNKDTAANLNDCSSDEIGAYLDGELTPERENILEAHFAVCEKCREELNLQKSFLLALNESLEYDKRIELPKDFTKTVVTTAESRVRGLRSRSERIAAFAICLLLLLVAAVAIGGDGPTVFSPAAALMDRAASVIDVGARLAYNIVFGATSLMRNAVAGVASSTSAAVFLVAGCVLMLIAAVLARFLKLFRDPG